MAGPTVPSCSAAPPVPVNILPARPLATWRWCSHVGSTVSLHSARLVVHCQPVLLTCEVDRNVSFHPSYSFVQHFVPTGNTHGSDRNTWLHRCPGHSSSPMWFRSRCPVRHAPRVHRHFLLMIALAGCYMRDLYWDCLSPSVAAQ